MSDKDGEKPEDKIKRLIKESTAESASNVTDFFAAAKRKGRNINPPTVLSPSAPVVQISGDNNAGIIGDSNHIQINIKSPPGRRPQINVQAGPDNISDAQAANIKELVDKVVATTGKPYPFVWSTLKKQYRFTKYQLITHDKYDDIVKYLRKWIASKSKLSLYDDTDTARKRALARIHAEAKKQKGLLDNVHAFTQGRFGTPSLAELTLGQLAEVIRQFRF